MPPHRSLRLLLVLVIPCLAGGLACKADRTRSGGGGTTSGTSNDSGGTMVLSSAGQTASTGGAGTGAAGTTDSGGTTGTGAAGQSGSAGHSGSAGTGTAGASGGKGGSAGAMSSGSSSLPLCAVDCFMRPTYQCTGENTYRGYGPVPVPQFCNCGGRYSRCTGTSCGYTTDELSCPSGTRCVQPQGGDAGIQGACQPITDAGANGQDAAAVDAGPTDLGSRETGSAEVAKLEVY